MSRPWLDPETSPPPPALVAAAGDPLLAALLVRRGQTDPAAVPGYLDQIGRAHV